MKPTLDHLRQAIAVLVDQGDLPEEIKRQPLEIDTRLEELELDSLNLAALALSLEDILEVELQWDTESELITLGDVLAACQVAADG